MRTRTTRETLLLVSADQRLLRVLSDGLEGLGGYACLRATSVIVAGEILRGSLSPAAVVVDVDAIDGLDAAGFIRHLGGRERLGDAGFVVVCTGHVPSSLGRPWHERAEIVTMPAPFDELLAAVNRSLS